MRTLGRQFNDPDREAVLEGLYRKVKPIDSATPTPDTTVSRTSLLQVSPVPLHGRAMHVSWSWDGVVMPTFDGKTTLDLSAYELPPGRHTVAATVQDTTSWVRDEDFRKRWMTQSVSWIVP
jgi:hypothetical protein